MLQSLNFFAPYQSLAAHHENQLTRALLVVLGFCPLAHARWLNLVDPELCLERLPEAEFRTQQSRLLPATAVDEEAVIRGISVFLTPDSKHKAAPVSSSDRHQILDGIIQYGDDLVVAIENKISTGVVTDQPSAINTHGVRIDFDQEVRKIEWQQLLEMLADISARTLVAGAERRILDDFLDFVEHHFSHVGPFSTLRRAEKSFERINKRLENVLAEAVDVPERSGIHEGRTLLPLPDGKQRSVEMAFLRMPPTSRHVVLQMYPGDTLFQSRMLYSRPHAVRNLLTTPGWTVRPNYHWGFMHKGECWATGSIDTAAYIEHWIKAIPKTGAVDRKHWDQVWAELEQLCIVSQADRIEFDASFTNTAKNSATPRPGLVCECQWTLEDAMRLDDTGKFVIAVRSQIEMLLDKLGDPLSPQTMRRN
jgi:hypothetical protein